MTVEQEQRTRPAPAVVIATQAPSTGCGAVSSLLATMEKAAKAGPWESRGAERPGVKRRRIATQGAGPNDAGNGGDDSPVCPPHPGSAF